MSLQELATSRIRRTPGGKLYARDFESFYAMLIVSLKLSEIPKKAGFWAKAYPFSFTITEAEMAMRSMSVTVQRGSTVTTIVCGVPENKVVGFLHRFMHARLLHCPSARTQETVTNSVLIQPTSKGLFFVGRYCARNGIRDEYVTKLLLSTYNSMRCISLERDTITDSIFTSGSFAIMMFQRFLGKEPNVYNPANPPDPIPLNPINTLYRESSEIEFYHPQNHALSGEVSPYAHHYFTHPDSSSVTQYYVSYRGVRLFKDKQFAPLTKRGGPPVKYDYVFTGKAAWQWFMECTDLVYAGEAVELANMFLESGLIEPILDEHSVGNYGSLVVSRDAFYKLSAKGVPYCLWKFRDHGQLDPQDFTWEESTSPIHRRFNPGMLNDEEMELESILSDAGLRLLFREHLEHNFCQENLLFYTETQQLLLRFETADRNDVGAIKRVLLLLYSIYNRYLAHRAPFELNLAWHVKKPLVDYLTMALDKEDPLTILENAAPLLTEVKRKIRKMLSEDSVPKFLRSPEYYSVNRAASPVIFGDK
jgi:GTPase-activating protein SST2